MGFLDNYGYDPIEVLRSALGGDNAPMLAKTQQMEAQDIGNQFRDRLPEFPVDAQPVPGPAYRGVRVASADPSFMPEMPSMGGPGPADASFSPPDPARMNPLQLAIAGGNGDVAGLTAGPRQATAPAMQPPGPGAVVDQNGSTQAVPTPPPAPARAAAVSGFPERNLSVPVGPASPAPSSPPAGGLLGNLISRDTLAAIARGLSGIQGRGKFASFARGAGSAYTGIQEQADTNAEKARKQSMEERELRRKEDDSASLRSYRASGAAGGGGDGGTDEAAALFGKGKRGVLDTMLRVEEAWQKMNDRHDKKRETEGRELETGSITQQKIDENEAKRQAEAARFMNTYGTILQRPPAAGAAAPAAAAAKKPAAALPSDRSTLKDGSEYTLKDGRVGRWNAKTKMMDIVGE